MINGKSKIVGHIQKMGQKRVQKYQRWCQSEQKLIRNLSQFINNL